MVFEIKAKNGPCEVKTEFLFHFSLHTDKEERFILQNYCYNIGTGGGLL
jgi:hypothetical protein